MTLQPRPDLENLTVQAESIAGRLRAHLATCELCSVPSGGPRPPCATRNRLQRLLRAARALLGPVPHRLRGT